MKAKMYGDVPAGDKEHAERLEEMEVWVKSDLTLQRVPEEERAKVMVGLAHDWMFMGMDDEAERLLRDASRACPYYYSRVMHMQIRDDYDFALIVFNLRRMLASGVLSALGLK